MAGRRVPYARTVGHQQPRHEGLEGLHACEANVRGGPAASAGPVLVQLLWWHKWEQHTGGLKLRHTRMNQHHHATVKEGMAAGTCRTSRGIGAFMSEPCARMGRPVMQA